MARLHCRRWAVRGVLPVLCGLLASVAGCGDADPVASWPDRPGAMTRLEVRGQPAVLVTPVRRTTKVVVYVHGSGERVGSIFGDSPMRPVFTRLLRAGYAIAASDAHGDNWGNEASERDHVALVKALETRGLRHVYVIALSMGGFNGLGLLDDVPVRAWAGIFVACDLSSVDDLGVYSGAIRDAYGLPHEDGAASAVSGRSPVVPRPRPGLPMRFWASPGDRIIPKGSNTDACAALARRRGARVEVTTTRGDHGDPSNFDPEGVLRLFASAPP